MKIAVISDTHDRTPAGLPDRLVDADEIWHLGDVCHPDTLLPIEALGIKMRIVSGNCDAFNLWPGAMGVTVGGLRFHLEHIAPRVAPPDTDVVLSGHTHCPDQRTEGSGCVENRSSRFAKIAGEFREGQNDRNHQYADDEE